MKALSIRTIIAPLLTLTVLATNITVSYALPISVDANGDPFEVNHSRQYRGMNAAGLAPQDRLVFGAVNVTPNGDNGTTGIARQGSSTVDLVFVPSTVNPNQLAQSVNYNSALTGSWELTFTNGTDTLTVFTPEVGDSPAMPLARNVRLTNTGLTPTVAWEVPNGPALPTPDRAKVSIYDLDDRRNGLANRIFIRTVDSATSLTVPDGVLQPNRNYEFAIELDQVRTDGINPSGSSQAGANLSRSSSFFAFNTGSTATPGSLDTPIFLPTVDLNGAGEAQPVYHFDFDVVGGELVLIDPLVAIGYDYTIGSNNPLFASVMLPMIGDGLFDLYLYDSLANDWVFDRVLSADTLFHFAGNGVDQFRILGIEPSAGLDPNDGGAFVTALSFSETGNFTGSMVPITANVPEPGTWALFLFAAVLVSKVRPYKQSRITA